MNIFKRVIGYFSIISVLAHTTLPAFAATEQDEAAAMVARIRNLEAVYGTLPIPTTQNLSAVDGETSAAVLPLMMVGGEIQVILGERNDGLGWCTFGGKSGKEHTLRETAMIEAGQESCGLLGDSFNNLASHTLVDAADKLCRMYIGFFSAIDIDHLNTLLQEAEGTSKEYTQFACVSLKGLLAASGSGIIPDVSGSAATLFSPMHSFLKEDRVQEILHAAMGVDSSRSVGAMRREMLIRLPGRTHTVRHVLAKPRGDQTVMPYPTIHHEVEGSVLTTTHSVDGEGTVCPHLITEKTVLNRKFEQARSFIWRQMMNAEFLEKRGARAEQSVALEEEDETNAKGVEGDAEADAQTTTVAASAWTGSPTVDTPLRSPSEEHLRLLLNDPYAQANPARIKEALMKTRWAFEGTAGGTISEEEIDYVLPTLEKFFMLEKDASEEHMRPFYHGVAGDIYEIWQVFSRLHGLLGVRHTQVAGGFDKITHLRGHHLVTRGFHRWIQEQGLNRNDITPQLIEAYYKNEHYAAETNNANICANIALLAGPKHSMSTSSSVQYFIKNHSVVQKRSTGIVHESLAYLSMSDILDWTVLDGLIKRHTYAAGGGLIQILLPREEASRIVLPRRLGTALIGGEYERLESGQDKAENVAPEVSILLDFEGARIIGKRYNPLPRKRRHQFHKDLTVYIVDALSTWLTRHRVPVAGSFDGAMPLLQEKYRKHLRLTETHGDLGHIRLQLTGLRSAAARMDKPELMTPAIVAMEKALELTMPPLHMTLPALEKIALFASDDDFQRAFDQLSPADKGKFNPIHFVKLSYFEGNKTLADTLSARYLREAKTINTLTKDEVTTLVIKLTKPTTDLRRFDDYVAELKDWTTTQDTTRLLVYIIRELENWQAWDIMMKVFGPPLRELFLDIFHLQPEKGLLSIPFSKEFKAFIDIQSALEKGCVNLGLGNIELLSERSAFHRASMISRLVSLGATNLDVPYQGYALGAWFADVLPNLGHITPRVLVDYRRLFTSGLVDRYPFIVRGEFNPDDVSMAQYDAAMQLESGHPIRKEMNSLPKIIYHAPEKMRAGLLEAWSTICNHARYLCTGNSNDVIKNVKLFLHSRMQFLCNEEPGLMKSMFSPGTEEYDTQDEKECNNLLRSIQRGQPIDKKASSVKIMRTLATAAYHGEWAFLANNLPILEVRPEVLLRESWLRIEEDTDPMIAELRRVSGSTSTNTIWKEKPVSIKEVMTAIASNTQTADIMRHILLSLDWDYLAMVKNFLLPMFPDTPEDTLESLFYKTPESVQALINVHGDVIYSEGTYGTPFNYRAMIRDKSWVQENMALLKEPVFMSVPQIVVLLHSMREHALPILKIHPDILEGLRHVSGVPLKELAMRVPNFAWVLEFLEGLWSDP